MSPLSKPLEPTLNGAERQLAHAAMRAHLDARDDAAAAALIARDPSLAVERIPAHDPVTGEADKDWNSQSTWYGTWLCKAAGLGLLKTVEAALVAGIHPDDTRAFAHSPLIRFPAWAVGAEHLAVAYRYGANPDNPACDASPDNPNSSFVRRAISDVSSALMSSKADSDGRLWAAMDRLELTLNAGARRVDLVDVESERFTRDDPAIFKLFALWDEDLGDASVARVDKLLGLLIAAGGDIDAVGGSAHLPPVLSCVHRKCVRGATMLIRHGARTDDAYIAGRTIPSMTIHGKPRTIGTLAEEAFAVGGQELAAQITEAMMQRRLLKQKTSVPAAEAPRRRQRRV